MSREHPVHTDDKEDGIERKRVTLFPVRREDKEGGNSKDYSLSKYDIDEIYALRNLESRIESIRAEEDNVRYEIHQWEDSMGEDQFSQMLIGESAMRLKKLDECMKAVHAKLARHGIWVRRQ